MESESLDHTMQWLYKVPHDLLPIHITLPAGQLDGVLQWCNDNIHNKFRIRQGSYHDESFDHTFYFSSEMDRMLFSLRWL